MTDTITKSITIKGPINRVFSLWADFEDFPNFMTDVKSVRKTSENTSHWVVQGPLGKEVEWDAQMTTLETNKRIAWNTIQGDVKTSGEVTFNPLGEDHTQAIVKMHFVLPAGKLGDAAIRILDNPDRKLEEDLKKFKKFAETAVKV
jgi:uncharacterized membrane protein